MSPAFLSATACFLHLKILAFKLAIRFSALSSFFELAGVLLFEDFEGAGVLLLEDFEGVAVGVSLAFSAFSFDVRTFMKRSILENFSVSPVFLAAEASRLHLAILALSCVICELPAGVFFGV